MKRIVNYIRAVAYSMQYKIKVFKAKLVNKDGKILQSQLIDEYYDGSNVNSVTPTTNKTVVFMVEGRIFHGGLTDRLRAICTAYQLCKQRNLTFKLKFSSPFKLTEYLMPNKYDWTITEEEISYDKKISKPIVLKTNFYFRRRHKDYFYKEIVSHQQIHFYGNTDIYDNHFSENFNELFKFSPRLQEDIDNNISAIDGHYVAVVFRFQQLLGDFKEHNYPTLKDYQKKILTDKCMQIINYVHKRHAGKKVLVTSDSITFLELAKKMDYVYVIPGKVVHMDCTSVDNFEVYEKSFLDMFILAKSDKIYFPHCKVMYRSGFPKRASMFFNTDYEEISFKVKL